MTVCIVVNGEKFQSHTGDLDLDRTMPNVELIQAIFIYYNMFKETGQEQDTQQPTNPQYEDVTQDSDLESVASSSASQSKRKRKFSYTLEQEEDLIDSYITSY